MATLEKIRSKSILLFCIVIVALLLMIIMFSVDDMRGLCQPSTTVAEVAGQKVDYHEFQQRKQELSEQYGNRADDAQLTQSAMQSLLAEKLLNNEYQQLGITVSDAEVAQAMGATTDQPLPQNSPFYMVAMQYNIPPTTQSILKAMANPAAYKIDNETNGLMKAQWRQMEIQAEDALKQQKLQALIVGTYRANKLDAKSLYDDVNNTYTVQYATHDFTSVPDDKVQVSDADLKDEYTKNKKRFELDQETRLVDFIAVNVEPSSEDIMAGQKEVENAMMGLMTQPNTQAIDGNSKFVKDAGKITIGALKANNQMDRTLRNKLVGTDNSKGALDTISVGQVVLLQHVGNNYNILKLNGVEQNVDSINLTIINTVDAKANDSVYNALVAGKPLADFLAVEGYSMGQDSLWTSLVGNLPFDETIAKDLLTAPLGQYVAYTDSANMQGPAYWVIKVNNRKPQVKVYDIALISYETVPSQETRTNLFNDLNQYVAANQTLADFKEKALEAGYEVMENVPISAGTASLGNLPNSRPAIKWAMEAKKGQVSPVLQDQRTQSYYVAVAVEDIYDDEFIPYTSPLVKTILEPQIIADKKAAVMIDQYKGKKSLAEYAQAMGAKVDTANINFARPTSAVLSSPKVIGAIAGAKPGQLQGPVQGNTQIVVFQVSNVDSEGRPYDYDTNAMQYNQRLQRSIINNMFDALIGDEKVENNSLRFESAGN